MSFSSSGFLQIGTIDNIESGTRFWRFPSIMGAFPGLNYNYGKLPTLFSHFLMIRVYFISFNIVSSLSQNFMLQMHRGTLANSFFNDNNINYILERIIHVSQRLIYYIVIELVKFCLHSERIFVNSFQNENQNTKIECISVYM